MFQFVMAIVLSTMMSIAVIGLCVLIFIELRDAWNESLDDITHDAFDGLTDDDTRKD